MASSAGAADQAAFRPALLPDPNPVEQLWGVMHRNVTHNKCYAACHPRISGLSRERGIAANFLLHRSLCRVHLGEQILVDHIEEPGG